MTLLRKIAIPTALLLLGLLCSTEQVAAAKPAKANMGEIRKIKLRMQHSFLPGKPYDAQVDEILKELQADGSFSNIDYQQDAFNTGGEKTPHLINLGKLAKAYATSPGTYYRSREVYDAITSGLKFWVELNPVDQNWWHRIIGYPKAMMVPLLLIADDMKRYDKELYAQCLDYLRFSWSDPKQRAQEGANGTDICKFTFTAAILAEDTELLAEVMEKVGSLIKIAHGDREEGIQADYSFTQHNGSGRQLYLASYGREYVDGVIYFMDFVSGTSYWFEPEKVAIFERLFLDGLAWTTYKGELDVNQYGRGLLRPGTGDSYITLTERLAAMKTPRSAELKQMIGPLKGTNELNGNRMYPRTDYMIHRPKGAMITTRMTSTRTVGNEAGNSEGMDNYHTGDGANYIKVSGDEYENVYAGWNWKRIPGTTVLFDTREMPAPMWGKGGEGGSDFASGVSDGTNGVAGFIYSKDSLRAHKSWFYFDNYFVALGAGIESMRKDAPAVTTVNQTRLADKAITNNGGTAAFDRLWHYNVGYRFEAGTTPTTENYAGVYKSDYKGKKTDILWIGIDHGTAPKQARYAYAVYPAIKESDFMARGEDYRILSNTAAIQAVQDIATGKVMAVFYEPGRFEADGLGVISADKPCFLIATIADSKVGISVANPYCESRPQESVQIEAAGRSATVAFKDAGNMVTR